MDRRRWIVSAFILWHVVAVGLRSLPAPDQLPKGPRRTVQYGGPLIGQVTAAVSGAGDSVLLPLARVLWLASTPIRPAVNTYTSLTGLHQTWAMFSVPPRVDRYMRVRYYVRPPRGAMWMATELVSPAHREDRIRLVRSFRYAQRDKAVSIALEGFYDHRKPDVVRPDTRPDELPDDLAPIARYYARRFARGLEEERIVRTEVWVGRARTRVPGTPHDSGAVANRLAALQEYYEGPVEQRFLVPPFPPYHGAETEADIEWLLEYYEERPS